ncbi:MAG: hypothetical protein M1834_002997 [Cirrosporium novae-zelandiae]|nr:MAG: hypothetical protein M1834_002997 [Cirrosporium novae-zelandiae]
MTLPNITPSISKDAFFRELGLTSAQNHIYDQMKREAEHYYLILIQGRDHLAPTYKNDMSIQPPYTAAQISDYSFRWAIVQIYNERSQMTAPWYDLGNTAGQYGPNSIIRWVLWHVFRYRDGRNNRRHDDDNGSRARKSTKSKPNPPKSSTYYDPARNGYSVH